MKNNHLISYGFLTSLSDIELLSLHSEILTQLRFRGVIRTKNNPVGDYAEWLVSNALGMTLLSNSSDRKSTRLNSSHLSQSRMPSSA